MKKKWFYRLIAPFLSQRGAVGEAEDSDKKEGGEDDSTFDDLVNSDIYSEDEDPLADNKETQDIKDGEKEEKKEPTIADVMAELQSVKEKNAELDKAAKRAFYGERHEKKAAKEKGDETVLTDAEIKAIIRDNKDDPEVLFNALTYKAQQMMKTGQKATIDEVEIKNKSNQFNSILKERVPDYDSPDSKAAETISKAKETFNLEDHPFADYLAASAAVYADLPNISKQWFEAGKKAALDEGADAARKKEIKNGQITPGGKRSGGDDKGGGSLSESQMETFNRIYGHVKDPKSRAEKISLFKSQLNLRKKAA